MSNCRFWCDIETRDITVRIGGLPDFRLPETDSLLLYWHILDRQPYSLDVFVPPDPISKVARVGLYYSANREEISAVTTERTTLGPSVVSFTERVPFLGDEMAELTKALGFLTEE